MRTSCLLALALAGAAIAAPDGWHGNLEDGVKAAKRSDKPVLVVTLWGNGV